MFRSKTLQVVLAVAATFGASKAFAYWAPRPEYQCLKGLTAFYSRTQPRIERLGIDMFFESAGSNTHYVLTPGNACAFEITTKSAALPTDSGRVYVNNLGDPNSFNFSGRPSQNNYEDAKALGCDTDEYPRIFDEAALRLRPQIEVWLARAIRTSADGMRPPTASYLKLLEEYLNSCKNMGPEEFRQTVNDSLTATERLLKKETPVKPLQTSTIID